MKTHEFRVVIEPDEDRWIAFCLELVEKGVSTRGYSREEASKNIREVLEMVIEDLLELGMPIPDPPEEAGVSPEERLAVTL